MHIRAAILDDLDGIMRVEKDAFGEAGEGTMASRELMERRIVLLNGGEPKWFLVAERKGIVYGYNVLQPTSLLPDDSTSWEASTDNGTLTATFDPQGETLYNVSLAVSKDAPPTTSDRLLHRTVLLWVKAKKKRFMFCSRMPGLRHAREKEGISAEEYWKRNSVTVPRDPLMKEFYEIFGVWSAKFLENGFAPDIQSDGHAALFVVEDPFFALDALVERVCRGCKVEKARELKRT